MAVQTAEAKVRITAEITDLEKKLQQAFALWKVQQEAMGRSTAEANLKMAGGLNTVTKAMRTASDQTGVLTKEKEKLTKAVEQAHGGFRIFGMNIVDIAAKFYLLQTSIRAVIQGLVGMFQLAELGAQVRQQGLAFQSLVEGSGKDYLAFMDELREKSGGLISDFELQQKASNAIIGTTGEVRTAMVEALPSLIEFSRAFAALHPDVGNAEYVLNSLVIGIRRASPRLIDNALIYLKLGEAVDTYAKSIGKSADELTNQERQMAIINATMEGGNIIVDQAGDLINSLTDRYTILRKGLNEAKQGLGEFLDSALAPTIDEMIKDLGVINDAKDSWTALGESLAPVVLKLYEIWKIYVSVVPNIFMLVNAVNKLTHAENQSAASSKDLSDALTGIAASASDSMYQIEKFEEKITSSLQGFRRTYVDIFIKAHEERQTLLDKQAKAIQDGADRETKINADLLTNNTLAYRKYTQNISDINDRFNKQRIAKLREIGQLELEIAGKLPLLESERIEKSISAIDDQTDALKQQLSTIEKLRDAAISGIGTEQDRREKLYDVEIEQAKLRDQIALRGGIATQEQIAQLAKLNFSWQSIHDSMNGAVPNVAQFESQIKEINDKLAELGENRLKQEKALNHSLLQERVASLRTEIDIIETERTDALAKAKEDYDQQLTDLANKAAASIKQLQDTTDETVDDIDTQIAKITIDLPKEIEKAWVDMGLAMAFPGSKQEEALLEWKAKTHGVIMDGMIPDMDAFIQKLISDGPEGFVGALKLAQFNAEKGIVIPVILDTTDLEQKAQQMTDYYHGIYDQQMQDYYHGTGDVNLLPQRVAMAKLIGTKWEGIFAWLLSQMLEGKQHGGSVMSGHPYIVGEGGPELFVPSAGGAIVPNPMFGGGMNVTIQAGAFLGSHADAIRLGSQLVPIIAKGLQSYNLTPWSLGSRRTGTQ